MMKRINGDDRVALKLRAVEDLLRSALRRLGQPGVEYADRCIEVAERLTRAELIFAGALGDLEAITDVPWTAIMGDPQFQVSPS